MDRRQFLGALGSAALASAAGCNNNTEQKPDTKQPPANQGSDTPPAERPNLYDVLAQHSFVGQDGQPVNIAGLKASLQNKHTTLSFGFAECENYCPMINSALSAVGKANPDITSIIVAANPEVDGADQQHRDAFMARLQREHVEHNVILLYPTRNGALSNAETPSVAQSVGAIVNTDSPLDHSAKVILYAPGGEHMQEKQGMRPPREFVEDWSPAIQARRR